MPIRMEDYGIDRLSVGDRLELIDQIWDSLPEQVAPGEIPAWHLPILEARLAEAEANPGTGVPYREAIESLLENQ